VAAGHRSLDYIDHTSRTGIDQHRPIIHDGVAIAPRDMIIRRYIIVGDPALGEYSSNPKFLLISIGGSFLSDSILAKSRSVLNAKDASNCAGSRSYRTAHNGAGWPGSSASLRRSLLGAADRALCTCWTGSNQRNE
jgi:hypothetical protein